MAMEQHVFELGQRNFSDQAAVGEDAPPPEQPYLGVLGLTPPVVEE